MCGIAGYLGQSQAGVLEKMTRKLSHRGPDDEGFFNSGVAHLGMRRLKIIDLSTGHQPMTTADGRYTTVFNGEIYNYQKLRGGLEKLGRKFRTQSDTEVILEGFAQWGTDVFAKLEGMFGFAIWDDYEKKLVIARDRFGEKPIYYGSFKGQFVFGSELKALLAHPATLKELDEEALADYLVLDYVPAPRSIFKGIKKLPPASFLTYSESVPLEIKKYWQLDLNTISTSPTEAAEQLEKLLERAVVSRMISDVPLGVFLSGGIDSSTIAYFAQKNSNQKVKTFSIGFDDKSFDESKYSKQVADILKTEHYHHTFSSHDTLRVIPQIFKSLDEPFSDASILPTYLLSQFTRQHVTVALDGDGSDELFGGYPTFQAQKFSWLYNLLPKGLLQTTVGLLPTSFNNITFEYGLKRIAATSDYPEEYRNFLWINSVLPHELKDLLAKENEEATSGQSVTRLLQTTMQDQGSSSRFNQMLALYLRLYLPDDILVKSDRASMMVALEGRAPFLANELSGFIASLPANLKLKNGTTKYLLKQVMRKHLPYEVVFRKKKGFGVPMAKWLNADLKPLLQETLNKDKIDKDGIFNSEMVAKLIADHQAMKKDNRKALWTLIVFQLWKQHWLD